MINNFRLLTKPSVRTSVITPPLRSTDFIEFNNVINEGYLDLITTDRVGGEILIESTLSGLSEENLILLNEGVLGTVWEGVKKLFSAIIDFIKGIINKLNVFADSMTSNISKWMKKVAPTALQHSKDPGYLSRLEYEGYKWNENFITNDLYASIGKILNTPAKIKTVKINQNGETSEIEESIISSPKNAAELINKRREELKNLFNYVNKKHKELEEDLKKKETDSKEKDTDENKETKTGVKDEMKIDIPEVGGKADDENKEPVKGSKADQGKSEKLVSEKGSGKEEFKKIISDYFQKEFGTSREKYEEDITLKAHGIKEPRAINKFSSSMIKSYIDFIANSRVVIDKIKDRYSSLLDEYVNLENAIESLSRDTTDSKDATFLKKYKSYIKDPVMNSIDFVRDCTAINNTLCRLNINLVEECTKEYIRICNKLALMGKKELLDTKGGK